MAAGNMKAKLIDFSIRFFPLEDGEVRATGTVAVWIEDENGGDHTIESVTVSATVPIAQIEGRTVAQIRTSIVNKAKLESARVNGMSVT